ncbi:hypothetical protein E3N88_14077 [Mikania micrantha]|uniref:Retrotransposon Copia-like N-terminal domain-containing protein n=1 Tax=Mikania micrantha TaxID=192012 RepID=A0A5N6P1Q5_9ASTR|nr:hypothetical protein E3N88_14077 [Mikania micrantha]
MASKPITQITAATHFPIKLTSSNFPVWRRQIKSTLIGLEIDSFISGETQPSSRLLVHKDQTKVNASYLPCTSREAWEHLNSSFTSGSRSRVISLKSKLAKNPKGSRSVTEYLQNMLSIADDLTLAQSPVIEEDLLVHILSQLDDEFGTTVAAIKELKLHYPTRNCLTN